LALVVHCALFSLISAAVGMLASMVIRGFIGMGLFLWLISVLWFAHVMSRTYPEWSSYVSHVTKKMLRRSMPGQGQGPDEMSEAVAELIVSKNLQRWKHGWKMALPVCILIYAWLAFVNGAVQFLWGEVEADFVEYFFFHDPMLTIIMYLGIILFFEVYPSLLTRRSHAVSYIVMMLFLVGRQSKISNICDGFLRRGMLRMMISVAAGSTPLVSAVELAHGVINIIIVFESTGAVDIEVCKLEATLVVLICITTSVMEQSHVAEIHATLKAKVSRNSETMAETLYAGMCDCTAHLDHSLIIIRPSQHLAGFLLRTPSPNAMQGMWFPALLHDADERDAFATLVGRPMGSVSNAMNVRLTDMMGNIVHARLFHTRGLNAKDETIHSIGILSQLDEERHLTERTSVLNPERTERIDEDVVSLLSSERLPLDITSPETAVAVWVDAVELQMQQYTPCFSMFCGPAPTIDMSLLDLIDCGADELKKLLQSFVNEAINDWTHARAGCQVRMKSRDPIVMGYNAYVDCAIDNPIDGDLNDVDEIVVRLTFHDIRIVKRSKDCRTRRAWPRAILHL